MLRIKTTVGDVRVTFKHPQPAAVVDTTTGEEYESQRVTYCWVVLNDRKQYVGVARLHPNDRYCKETGRKVALTKAIKDWDKELRAEMWEGYFARKTNGLPREDPAA